jgi:hypothetical protein
MRRWQGQGTAGQATSEYVALVALVAVVLTLAAGLTAGGVGGEVLVGLQRGLCHVADVRCPQASRPRDELDPCPLERMTRAESLGGVVEMMALGGGRALTTVRMSDGRVQIMLADVETVGGAIGFGYSIGLGRRHDATVTVDVERHFAPGRSWTLPDSASARAFLERYGAKATVGGKAVDLVRSGCAILCDAIGWRPHPVLPPADEVSFERGLSGRLGGTLGVAGFETASDHLLGMRVRRDGGSTLYLGFDAAVGAALLSSAGLGVRHADQAVASFTLDARHRPVALSVQTVSSGAASAHVQASGRVSARVDGAVARVTESTATLDLRDRRNLAAALALRRTLAGGLAPQRLRRSAAAVGRRIARAGVIDRRTYALTSSGAAIGGTLVLGAQLGGGLERTRAGMRLISAQTRLPGLPFLPRDDCRPA